MWGCGSAFGGPAAVDPLLARRLPGMRAALRPVARAGEALTLRYDVESFDGRWRWDVLVGDRVFAERRTRLDGESTYTFGEDEAGPWLRVGDAPARAAEPHWRREARTRAALFGMRFLSPALGEEATYLGDGIGTWEYAFRPAGGRTLNLVVDAETSRPLSFDLVDRFGRLNVCESIAWTVRQGRTVPARGTCGAINGLGHRRYEWSFELRDSSIGASTTAALPAWARADDARDAPPVPRVVEVPMEHEDRVELAVAAERAPAGEPALSFVLDSGADHTVIDESVAEIAGVVPTGDPPIYYEPPWLPSGNNTVGVADRLDVAGVRLDGPVILVMNGLGGTHGLLGNDFFRRFVVDVDTPGRRLRLVPPEQYAAGPDAVALHALTIERVPQITAEVPGVLQAQMLVDTGASFPLFVVSPRFNAGRPRRAGLDAFFGALIDGTVTPDYWTDAPGLRVGPFELPAMPAVSRDRARERMRGDLGIIGMGTLRHFRVGFDLRQSRLLFEPGDGYLALRRIGLVLEDGGEGEGPFVSWVVPRSHAEAALIAIDDQLVAIDGIAVEDLRAARSRLAHAEGDRVRLGLRREGRTRTITVALDPPPER